MVSVSSGRSVSVMTIPCGNFPRLGTQALQCTSNECIPVAAVVDDVINLDCGRNAPNCLADPAQRLPLVSYFLVRTPDGAFSVSVFQDKAGADESVRVARDWINKNASTTGASAPTVSEGTVILHAK